MDFTRLLDDAETKYGLPKGILHAQMQAESNGNPEARSPKGALGLMQFMPATAKQYGIDPMNPEQSIDGAGRYMADLVKQTGSPRKAVAAYNWGIGNLQRKGIDNAPEETRNYINKVSTGMKRVAKAGLDAVSSTAVAAPAQQAFDPDAYLSKKAAPTAAFDPDAYLASKTPKAAAPEKSFNDKVFDGMKNYAGGLARGAGSIGATVLAPFDMAKDALDGKGLSLESNRQRRADIDAGLNTMGVDTDSGIYGLGKGVTEVAGSLGAGGVVGNAVGKVAPALGEAIASGGFNLGKAPAVNIGEKIANAATRIGGGAINGGATIGMINPEDAGTGALIGGAFPAAAKIAGETGIMVNAGVKPFYESGRDKIIGQRLLEQAGDNSADVINNLKTAQGNTAGFNPTVGQAANNAELATMERVLSGGNVAEFQDTFNSQKKALVDAIRSNGGDDIQRQALVDARTQASEPLFNAANTQPVQLTPEIEALTQRQSMQDAIKRAENIAREKGEAFDINAMTGADAQRIKMGLDDLVNTGGQSGLGGNELNAIRDTKTSYLGELEKQIPDYIDANKAFREGSAPINQLDLGNAITDKFIPATSRDMDIPASLNYETLARTLRDSGDGLAKKVTGFKGATLENTASPKQMQDYQNVLKDIEYLKQGEAGSMKGSPTFQNLLFNEKTKDGILMQIPAFKGLSAATLLRTRDFIYKQPNEAIQRKLLTVLQDPQGAAALMESAQKGSGTPALIRMLKNPALANTSEVMLAQ